MLRVILRRLLLNIVPTMFGVVILCFILLHLVPGDVADVIAAQSGSATAAGMEQMRQAMGLDQSMVVQLLLYIKRLAMFDLGYSLRFNLPVSTLILQRLPNTLLLMIVALSLALVLGVVAGWVMALFRGRLVDRVMQVLVLLLYSTPGFWIGLMAIVLFSVKLDWLPSSDNLTIGQQFEGLQALRDRVSHLVLPSIALASFYVAIYAPLMRATMIEVQQQDYMRTAMAKGLHPFVIQMRHALKNALIPVTTMAGLHVGNLLGGAVVIETVFNWPGMGRLALEAVTGRDFNVLLGVLLLSSFVVIVMNAMIDLIQMWLDPRIEAR
jgi:peptide/nickel transport system permease protein